VNALVAVLWKDLLAEWRSRDRLTAMLVFSLLVVLIFQLVLPRQTPEQARALGPALLWIAWLFAALLGLNRAFALELENEALAGLALAPSDRGWIYLGKAGASFALLAGVQLVTAVVFAAVAGLDLAPVALPFAGVVALGSLGICSVGTLFAAIAVRTRYREVMLPLLLLPLLVPVLLGAVRASLGLLEDGAAPADALRLLAVTDGVYGILSFLVFEWVLDE
jgi:heme exporter protein B